MTESWATSIATREEMEDFGTRLADVLQPGDLVILAGGLGAGKTVLTRGIGRGLGVRGEVTSPTFVIARSHPGGRVPLVHVDAYRLNSLAEVDDLDLDSTLSECVTIVEWGRDRVEDISDARLDIDIAVVEENDGDDQMRTLIISPTGDRWSSVDWSQFDGLAAC